MKRMFTLLGCLGLLSMLLLAQGLEGAFATWRELLFPALAVSGLLLLGAYGPRLCGRRKHRAVRPLLRVRRTQSTSPHFAA